MAGIAKTGPVSQESLLNIKAKVLNDVVALGKWMQIVDHIVKVPLDVFSIKMKWEKNQFEESVHDTLQRWNSEGGKIEVLIAGLREQKLNSLANEIIVSSFGLQPVTSHLALAQQENVDDIQTECIRGIWFDVEEPLFNFAGRTLELPTLHEMLIAAHGKSSTTENVICVHGLGGVGKTQFATKYAWIYGQHYDGNVVWIKAGTESSIKESFTKLSTKLDLEVSSSSEQVAARVYDHFKSAKCLFIFDNVEEKSDLRKWQPKFRYPNQTIPHVFVTSRISDLTPLPENQLKLDVLQPDESVELIRRLLPNSPRKIAIELGNRLQHFPLALQQAVAYIHDAYIDDEEAIPKYLQEFDSSKKKLLEDDKFKELLETEYHWTTFTVWRITLTRIEGLMPGGPDAIRLLNMFAYLKPDSISVDFPRKILDAEPALKLLQRFSMIHVTKAKVVIHRLVQDVIRLNLSSEEEISALVHLMLAIEELFQTSEFTDLVRREFRALTRECTSHGLHLFQFQLKHQKTMEDKYMYLSRLCRCLMQYGNHDECLSIYQQAVSYYEATYGAEHVSTLETKCRMAATYTRLKQYPNSMAILQSILPIANSNLGPQDNVTTNILASLAHVYVEVGDYAKALEIYDESIHRTSGHPPVEPYVTRSFAYKDWKAILLRALKRVDEALELQEEVYAKYLNRFGKNHPRTLQSMHEIGFCHLAKGDPAKALVILDEVEFGYKATLGETHVNTIELRKSIELVRSHISGATHN